GRWLIPIASMAHARPERQIRQGDSPRNPRASEKAARGAGVGSGPCPGRRGRRRGGPGRGRSGKDAPPGGGGDTREGDSGTGGRPVTPAKTARGNAITYAHKRNSRPRGGRSSAAESRREPARRPAPAGSWRGARRRAFPCGRRRGWGRNTSSAAAGGGRW